MDTGRTVMIVAWRGLIGAWSRGMLEMGSEFRVDGIVKPTARGELRDLHSQLQAVLIAGNDAPVPRAPSIVSLAERIRESHPALPIVVVVPDDCLTVHFVQGLVRKGVSGCIDLECSEREFRTCVRSACDGSNYFSPRVASLIREYSDWTNRDGLRGSGPDLTPAECEVLELLEEGMTVAEVAAHLKKALTTVQTHVKRAYFKLGASNRTEALRLYRIARAVTSPDESDPDEE